jgi:CheY-like chemotaxis protein
VIRDLIRRYWHSQPRVESHPVRVDALVVEDQKDEAEMLKTLLWHQGAVTVVAASIASALEHLAGPVPFQIAFVDLSLPNGSGIEVVRLIRDRRRWCHVVVVSGAIEKIPLVISYGYIGVLGKPYTVNSIGEILWKHRLPCSI